MLCSKKYPFSISLPTQSPGIPYYDNMKAADLKPQENRNNISTGLKRWRRKGGGIVKGRTLNKNVATATTQLARAGESQPLIKKGKQERATSKEIVKQEQSTKERRLEQLTATNKRNKNHNLGTC